MVNQMQASPVDLERGIMVFRCQDGTQEIWERWEGLRDKFSIRRRLSRDRQKHGSAEVWIEISSSKNGETIKLGQLDKSLAVTIQSRTISASQIRINDAAILATLTRGKR